MARLNTTVHVHFPDGHTEVFGPGDDVPAEAAALIKARSVWAEEPKQETAPVPKRARAKKL